MATNNETIKVTKNIDLSDISPSVSVYNILPIEKYTYVTLPNVGENSNNIRDGCSIEICNLSKDNQFELLNSKFVRIDTINGNSTKVYTADESAVNNWVDNSAINSTSGTLVSQNSNSFSFNPGYLFPNFGKLGFQVDRFLSPNIVLNAATSTITIYSPGRYSFNFWCNLLVDDSNTSYSLFLRKTQPQTINYARVITPKLQPGKINEYSTCTMGTLVDVNAKDQFIVVLQRNSGSGNVIVNTSIEAYLDIVKID